MTHSENENYKWDDLLAIVKRLRAPDGCPWDRSQTHESMRNCLIEECYEVLEAIENKDTLNLREELGDVLLQVLLHSEIAQEEKEFTLDDVINELSNKLVRRHPHVFGENQAAKDAKEGLSIWESVKQNEKALRREELRKLIKEGKLDASLLTREESLNELERIPKSFPAIIRAQKVQKKALSNYDDKFELDDSINNIKNFIEVFERNQDSDSQKLVEENLLGNLMFEVIKLSGYIGENAEKSLTKATEKYINKIIGCST